LVADTDGIYHLILTGEEDEEAFSKIPSNTRIKTHDALEIMNSFRKARESGNFEDLDVSIPLEEFIKDKPQLLFKRVIEGPDDTHNTHCDGGETVSTWWKHNTSARPSLTDGIEDHVLILFQQNAHPWWNYVVFATWGVECAVEVYLLYNTSSNTPQLEFVDWTCTSTGGCSGQSGTGPCSGTVSKSTLLNGYVANAYDGQHWFPVVYPVVNEFYIPSENPTYPYVNEVWMHRFSTSSWTRFHLRRHSSRQIIPNNSSHRRSMWIEYHYGFSGGPFCSGQTHPDFGFIDYWHCKSPDGKNGNCTWHRPTSSNSFVMNDFSNPITIRHVVPNYTWHATKP
jgi:hypothetical protein